MIRARPAIFGPAQPSIRLLLGEAMLLVLLVVTAASSWRDGISADELAVQPALTAGAYADVPGNSLSGPTHLRPPLPVAPPASPLPRGPVSPPVQLLIPVLDVHRAVEKVWIDQFGTLDLPVNAWNAGWFSGGPVPGARGDAVIEGHAGYPKHPMIFGRLATLRPGDRIIVVHADGTRRLFLVVSMQTVAAGSFPPGLAEPSGPSRLTLVTCTGHFDKKNFWYSDRLLVEARYAGLA
jgi:LPXTG-site transpeptidase (sortase) family protein